jgi:hypothetical protein
VKKILCVLTLLLVLAGCNGQSGTPGSTKTFDLNGHKVSFTAPPDPWKEKPQVEMPAPEDGKLSDKPTTIGVSFQKPDYKGFFAVGTMDQRTENGKPVELESDQETLDVIAMWVEKRDGERLKQEWIPLAGTNAFHMVFEIGKQEDRMKGEQVHFTSNGVHYTLSMLMPAKDYGSEVGHFQRMISSFKLEPSGQPDAKTGQAAP